MSIEDNPLSRIDVLRAKAWEDYEIEKARERYSGQRTMRDDPASYEYDPIKDRARWNE